MLKYKGNVQSQIFLFFRLFPFVSFPQTSEAISYPERYEKRMVVNIPHSPPMSHSHAEPQLTYPFLFRSVRSTRGSL